MTVGDQHYQVHRRMRQKLVEQQRVSRSAGPKENLSRVAAVVEQLVGAEELVRLEVSGKDFTVVENYNQVGHDLIFYYLKILKGNFMN